LTLRKSLVVTTGSGFVGSGVSGSVWPGQEQNKNEERQIKKAKRRSLKKVKYFISV